MDDQRVGRSLRALRRRRGWRQLDLAERAGVSQQTISLVERGHLDRLGLRTVRGIFMTVDASAAIDLRWRGADLDRLMDDDHAALVGTTVAWLRRIGWEPSIEVTYSRYGERGSIDVLAWRAHERAALMIEAKASIGAADETVRRADVKSRLLADVVAQRHGRAPNVTGRLLVVLDGTTNRRRIDRHAAVFGVAFPVRGQAVRRWLRRPSETMSGLIFLPVTHTGGGRQARRSRDRIRRPAPAIERTEPRSVERGATDGSAAAGSLMRAQPA